MTSAPDEPDALAAALARYAAGPLAIGGLARQKARYCLLDALGCAALARNVPDCMARVRPLFAEVAGGGVDIPFTRYRADPVGAAFATSCLIRWLDFNDTWWSGGHPSDNLGGLLAAALYVDAVRARTGAERLTVGDLIEPMVKAYEIHGLISAENRMDGNDVRLDAVIFLRIASAAACTFLLGGDEAAVLAAVTQAFGDGGRLNAHRHPPNVGARKAWASGDETARGLWLAARAMAGEESSRRVLTTPVWGFSDTLYKGVPLKVSRPFGTHVIEHVQFKVPFPAQRHSQSAAECAARLHSAVRGRVGDIDKVVVTTHRAALATIDVKGPLPNPAARDHCLQYIVAAALLDGTLSPASYEDARAADPALAALRERVELVEDPFYSARYYDPEIRANAGRVQMFFTDGTASDSVELHYPLGHPSRFDEARAAIIAKFERGIEGTCAAEHVALLLDGFSDGAALETLPLAQLIAMLRPADEADD